MEAYYFKIIWQKRMVYVAAYKNLYTVNLDRQVVELTFDYDEHANPVWLIDGKSSGFSEAIGAAIEWAHL